MKSSTLNRQTSQPINKNYYSLWIISSKQPLLKNLNVHYWKHNLGTRFKEYQRAYLIWIESRITLELKLIIWQIAKYEST